MVWIAKFCLNRLKSSSTCQRLLYRCRISSPLYSVPREVMTMTHPAHSNVSVPIRCWFFDALRLLRFLAVAAWLSESFCAITRTKPVLFLYLQKPKTSIPSMRFSSASFIIVVREIFLPSASYRQKHFGVMRKMTSAPCSCA